MISSKSKYDTKAEDQDMVLALCNIKELISTQKERSMGISVNSGFITTT